MRRDNEGMLLMNPVHIPIYGIISDPKLRSGRPVIDGTTIRVMDVVALYKYKQRSTEEISGDYVLTLAQVHAALAYYYAHQSEIDTDLDNERRLIEAAHKEI